MPSSLLFVALAAAWLIVLVPMFARRRQEVSRTTDAALAARVVRRGSGRHPAANGAPTSDSLQEAFEMPERDQQATDVADTEEADFDGDYRDEDQWRPVYSDDVRAGRRYRPGRGGFDPEAAALAARAKYARRQRTVLIMLLAGTGAGLLAGFMWPAMWWAVAGIGVLLAGYLTYLRRQVRIEEDVRNRRLARLNGASNAATEELEEHDRDLPADDDPDTGAAEDSDTAATAPRQPVETPAPSNAVVVELDDEDPVFDELDERTWEPYRRAAGE